MPILSDRITRCLRGGYLQGGNFYCLNHAITALSAHSAAFPSHSAEAPSEIPRYRRGRHSRRADIRKLGTERHSGEMIGFEATFLQPQA